MIRPEVLDDLERLICCCQKDANIGLFFTHYFDIYFFVLQWLCPSADDCAFQSAGGNSLSRWERNWADAIFG
jgi:hypothetical protein